MAEVNTTNKNLCGARGRLLTPVILATQEAEILMIKVQSQLGQIVHETLSQEKPSPGLVEWLNM
jgi:hypothetical protein